jgi:hypothetical protein
MTPQELKHGSPRTNKSVVPDVDEPTSKDPIDGEFNEGDPVLVRTTRTESRDKLEPKWEGPFIVKMKASLVPTGWQHHPAKT